MIVYDVSSNRRSETPHRAKSCGHVILWRRIATKLLGLWGTVGLLSIGYLLIPEYCKEMYQPVWQAIGWAAAPVVVVSIAYVAWMDSRMRDPRDGYWHAGRLFCGRLSGLDWNVLRKYSLGWLVKGFFLPLMLGGAAEYYRVLREHGVNFATFGELYSTTFNLLLTVDVTFGAIGYLTTFRLTGTQIRSVDQTWLGWVAGICCYAPFSDALLAKRFDYEGAITWSEWLSHSPILLISWGFVILMLHAIYAWATVSFGIRFSNLTNRGIITTGPYRFFKHPAYLTKNLAWWLMAVPFVAVDSYGDALWRCSCLLAINGIYALRAWTEERHLMSDPVYREYSAWMRENGVWAHWRRWWRHA